MKRNPASATWLTGLSLLILGLSAHATPVDQYLKLRRAAGLDQRLTWSIVRDVPSQYVGKVLELRGSVTGSIRRTVAEGGVEALRVSFLLEMEDKQQVLLNAPPAEIRMVTDGAHTPYRVLVRVVNQVLGNASPLETLAVAIEADVAARELEAVQREAAAQAAAQAEAARRAGAARPQQGAAVSVGVGGVRVRPLASAMQGVSEMARTYLSPEGQSIYPYYASFIQHWNKKLSPADVDGITVSLLYFAQKHRVDPRLAVAMIIAESDFDPKSTSNKGAMGLGQIMPDEARSFHMTNPYDPVQNVRVSVNMLKLKLDMYRDPGSPAGALSWRQIALTMAAYNAGSGAVRRYGGVPPYRETQRYVQRVIKTYRELCGG